MAHDFLQLYSTAILYVNSSVLTEEYELAIDFLSNSNPVDTVGIGYAGDVSGPKRCEITVTNAVPSTGFELDPLRFIAVTQELSFSIFAAGNVLAFNGFIESSNFASAVNTSARLSFRARGVFTGWK